MYNHMGHVAMIKNDLFSPIIFHVTDLIDHSGSNKSELNPAYCKPPHINAEQHNGINVQSDTQVEC